MRPLPVLEIRPQLQISADPFLHLLPPDKQGQVITQAIQPIPSPVRPTTPKPRVSKSSTHDGNHPQPTHWVRRKRVISAKSAVQKVSRQGTASSKVAPGPFYSLRRSFARNSTFPCIISLNGQRSLDDIVTHQPRAPPFSADGLLYYLVGLVVFEDKAFQLIDKDKDIPHRQTLRNETIKKAKLSEARLKELLKDVPGKVSFACDAWTSQVGDPYLSITGHFVHGVGAD